MSIFDSIQTSEFLDAQTIFDRVASHLLAQKASAFDHDGNCVYRNYQGLKCAVGCLIPDQDYTSKIEGFSIPFEGVTLTSEIAEKSELLSKILLKNKIDLQDSKIRNLLRSLQNIHDSCNGRSFFSDLKILAQKLELEFKFEQEKANVC